jgi:hypothetical protein
MNYTVLSGVGIHADKNTAYLLALKDAKADSLNTYESRRTSYVASELNKVRPSEFEFSDMKNYPSYTSVIFSDEPERLCGAGFCVISEQFTDTAMVFHGEYFGMDTNEMKDHLADSSYLQYQRMHALSGDVNADWLDGEYEWRSPGSIIKPSVTTKVRRLPRTDRGKTICVVLVAVFEG